MEIKHADQSGAPVQSEMQQFGYAQGAQPGLGKNMARLMILFALSSLCMICKRNLMLEG